MNDGGSSVRVDAVREKRWADCSFFFCIVENSSNDTRKLEFSFFEKIEIGRHSGD